MHQCPGSATRFVKHIVDLVPGGFNVNLAVGGGRLHRIGFAGEVGIKAGLPDAGAQSLRQTTQAFFNLAEPVFQIVRAGIKLRILRARVLQAIEVTIESIYAFLVNIFRSGKNPRFTIKIKIWFGDNQILVFSRLRLRAAEVVAHRARDVAHLNQHTEFPVGNIVQPD